MGEVKEVLVPDIGDFEEVDVIEVLVGSGDKVKPEDSLIVLESDKATMDVPSPLAGAVRDVKVKAGDRVAQGALILTLEVTEVGGIGSGGARCDGAGQRAGGAVPVPPRSVVEAPPAAAPPPPPQAIDPNAFTKAYASPSVRRFARELGVDLTRVQGSGRKARILKEDVQGFIKGALSEPAARGAAAA